MLTGTFIKAARAILNIDQKSLSKLTNHLIAKHKVIMMESKTGICDERLFTRTLITKVFLDRKIYQRIRDKKLYIFYNLQLFKEEMQQLKLAKQKDLPIVFGEYIRAARSILGITQDSMASYLEMSNNKRVALEKIYGLIATDSVLFKNLTSVVNTIAQIFHFRDCINKLSNIFTYICVTNN